VYKSHGLQKKEKSPQVFQSNSRVECMSARELFSKFPRSYIFLRLGAALIPIQYWRILGCQENLGSILVEVIITY
jgi:hypothetical protein